MAETIEFWPKLQSELRKSASVCSLSYDRVARWSAGRARIDDLRLLPFDPWLEFLGRSPGKTEPQRDDAGTGREKLGSVRQVGSSICMHSLHGV